MHLRRIHLFGQVPPFDRQIGINFDEQVNVFVGPNASGKSTILKRLANWFNGLEYNSKLSDMENLFTLRAVWHTLTVSDDWPETEGESTMGPEIWHTLTVSDDWPETEGEPTIGPESPPAIHIGSVREGLPGISNQENSDAFGATAAEILAGPFSGSRTMAVVMLLGEELWRSATGNFPVFESHTLLEAIKLADDCSKQICNEVIRDSEPHDYVYGNDRWHEIHHPRANRNITALSLMGINTTDIRHFDGLPKNEQPALLASLDYHQTGPERPSLQYSNLEPPESMPIYLGHLSSGTEGTLLWIRWLALKMVYHYGFQRGWHEKPAILLIDEIENHLHPTWQRRVIPALLEYFPGLQIFATTHSPFVVAGLSAGQVHLLQRDANGVVTASTNERDVIGWTADEILRTLMGVDEPTDQLTVDRANRLRELRRKESRTTEEETELQELRRQVNRDLLSKSGPLEAQRERYADFMQEFLRSRQSDLAQDGE